MGLRSQSASTLTKFLCFLLKIRTDEDFLVGIFSCRDFYVVFEQLFLRGFSSNFFASFFCGFFLQFFDNFDGDFLRDFFFGDFLR